MASLTHINGRGMIQFPAGPRTRRRDEKKSSCSAFGVGAATRARSNEKSARVLPPKGVRTESLGFSGLFSAFRGVCSSTMRYDNDPKKVVTYFIQRADGGPIKIGSTINLNTRLSTMQTASPVTFVCIAIIKGEREQELHEKFHHLRICGEWFEPAQDLLDYIAQNARKTNISRPLWKPRLGQKFAGPHSRKKVGVQS